MPPDAQSLRDQAAFEGGVGFNRLSILDLTKAGHQPMASTDGQVILTYNGEVYNAFDYRAELERSGVRFRSNTDTEIILELYRCHGLEGTLQRLNGMFALCIVDLRNNELLLVRDQLGIKPLYWYKRGGTFLFASEIKAFYGHPDFDAKLEDEHLAEHFMFRYCAGPRTLLKNVHHLEPGHLLRISPDGLTQRQYWKIPAFSRRFVTRDRPSLEEIEWSLSRSVKSQLLSDVKVGSQLSGGIDSSLITKLAIEQGATALDAFSVIFSDPQLSEESWIDEAAETAGVRAHKFELDPAYIVTHLEQATWHQDHPLNHPNSLGIYFLAERSKPYVTVLLSGEGADELFGGYTRFLYASLRSTVRPFAPWLRMLPGVGKKLDRRYSANRHLNDVDWFILQSAFLDLNEVEQLIGPTSLEQAIGARREAFTLEDDSYVANCLIYAMRTYMADLLLRQDKMTMAHSLENRVPFLDRDFVELVRFMPTRELVRARPSKNFRMKSTKIALKRITATRFRHDFVFRTKSGFPLPLEQCFQEPHLRGKLENDLWPGCASRLGRAHQAGPSTASFSGASSETKWVATAFELWARTFIDKNPVTSGPFS